MTPPVSAMPGHVAGDNPTADALAHALDEMPPEARASVQSQLVAAVAHYHATGDSGMLRHFAESLLVTARLYRNSAFQEALAEADASDARRPRGEAIDFEEFASARGIRRRGG